MTNAAKDERLIIGGQLRSAREAIGLPVEQAAEGLEMSPALLSNWEDERSEPSVEMLWRIAEFYGRDVDYFLKPVAEPAVQSDFRLTNVRALPQMDIADRRVLVKFQELCRAQTELETLLAASQAPSLKKVSPRPAPVELAKHQRKALDLSTQPVNDIRALLARAGVKVFHLPVPGNEFSGFSWWHEQYGPGVLVNSSDVAGRRAFTTAHELAHLLTSDRSVICDLLMDVDDERYANRFAAEFLIPAEDLAQELDKRPPLSREPTDSDLGSLARRYGVSLEAMGRRLESLELLPSGFTDSRIAEWEREQQFYRRSREPVWKRRLGDTFVDLAFRAHSDGLLSLSKLAQLFEVDVRKALALTQPDAP